MDDKILEPIIRAFPEWTLDDFEAAIPHGWLFNNYYKSPFTFKKALNQIDQIAQLVGYEGFKAEMRDYAKQFGGKKPLDTDYEGVTEWSKQPMQLNCGLYVCNDNVGVMSTQGSNEIICPHPLMVSGRLVNLDSGEIRLKVAFRRKVWREIVVEKTILASANKIIDLARFGIAVDSENAKALVKFLSDLESLNYDALPEQHSVERIGWTSTGDFMPYSDSVQFDGSPSFQGVFSSFCPHGDREKWFAAANKVRCESTIARIVLATSLASVLVKPLHALPFFLHVWGRAGNGKTMLLKLAASCWASPNDSDGYVRNFNSTIVGLETAAGFFNSAPFCLDELQVVKNKRDFDDIIYALCEGQGRSRGAKDGSMQRLKSWRNAILTTGEMPISSGNSGAGALNRVIEIACGEERLMSDYRGLAETISDNWGFAGKEFVAGLTPQVLTAAKALQEQYRVELESSSTTEKLSLAASLILTADAIAERLIWHSGTTLRPDDIARYLPSKDEVDVNRRALNWLLDTIVEQSYHFETPGGDTPREIWGEYKFDEDGERAVAIISSVFDRIVTDAGFNAAGFRAWLCEEGLARRGLDGKTSFAVRIHGRAARCVYLTLPNNIHA